MRRKGVIILIRIEYLEQLHKSEGTHGEVVFGVHKRGMQFGPLLINEKEWIVTAAAISTRTIGTVDTQVIRNLSQQSDYNRTTPSKQMYKTEQKTLPTADDFRRLHHIEVFA